MEVEEQRQQLVSMLRTRGIRDERVLEAMGAVARHAFVPEELREFAYRDTALPIGEEQTISQPYMVAVMAELLALEEGDRVLEVGAGSGYAAAVLAEMGARVFGIERHQDLVERAREALTEVGYDDRVELRHGDGSRGWAEQAPFQAILVSAGGRTVPPALAQQMAIGGRLVIPLGQEETEQELVRITRTGQDTYEQVVLGRVRFVPLVGEGGWPGETPTGSDGRPPTLVGRQRAGANAGGEAGQDEPAGAPEAIAQQAEPFARIAEADLSGLLERIGDARFVLLGEASHGTSEFYRFRARLTQELVERKGFDTLALEADWPDTARIDAYVRGRTPSPAKWEAFARFPTWMWRNQEMHYLVQWLRSHNQRVGEPDGQVSVHGLDLYSLYNSIDEVLSFLDEADPRTASIARERYGCLQPWQGDPAAYGRSALSEPYRSCEGQVVAMLDRFLEDNLRGLAGSRDAYFDAVQNARVVADAEAYYREMYYGSVSSWNLRDQHMFDTLEALMDHKGEESKVVVWAHNSHLSDARATEMGSRGEHNLGQLVRQAHGDQSRLVGFGTHAGSVAAASQWGGPMEVKQVRPSIEGSYERLAHESGVERFVLPLDRGPAREALMEPRMERAIGVIYRPESERASHYFQATLPRQFDEYVWFDHSSAVTALATGREEGVPETYPFGM